MQNKRVIAVLIGALIVIGIVAFAMTKKTETPATGTEIAASTEETTADTAPADTAAPAADTSETASTDTAGENPEAAATDTTADGSLLAAPSALQIDVPKIMTDRVLGKADAPVTIIEYASMTCPHCANFNNNVMPQLKKELIETGKAKLIFREFPLNAPAVKASMLARCAPEEKFYNIIDVLFNNQDRWMAADDVEKSLTQYGTLAGMDEDYIKACLANVELETAIVKGLQDAQTKYDIKATPTFILNDGAEKLTGGDGVEVFVQAVDKLSAQAPATGN